jgi:hypothetical protein
MLVLLVVLRVEAMWIGRCRRPGGYLIDVPRRRFGGELSLGSASVCRAEAECLEVLVPKEPLALISPHPNGAGPGSDNGPCSWGLGNPQRVLPSAKATVACWNNAALLLLPGRRAGEHLC